MRSIILATAMATAVTTFTAASVQIAAASPVPDYKCKGAAAATAKLFPNLGGAGESIYKMGDETVGLVGYAEKTEQLQLDSASGEGTGYTGHGVRFFEASEASGLDSALIIESTGQRIICNSTKIVSNIEGVGEKGWISGRAYESNVRDAPSVDGRKIDTLPIGEELAILRNEGNDYQGYPWFQVEYSEGFRGFIWGGTLCSEGRKIKGVADQC